MALTGYGWTASATPADFGGITTIKVGPKGTAFRMRKSLAKDGKDAILADFWRFVLWEFERIEPSAEGRVPDEWSYYFKKNTNDQNSYSQHAGGQAFDWNAVQHPNGTKQSTGWTSLQVQKILALIKRCRNLIGWGGNFNRTVDPMHVEIANGTADTEGHNRIKAFVLEVVRPAFKAHPELYGLPTAPVPPVIVSPVEPPVVTPEPPVQAFAVPGPYSLLAVLDAPGAGNWQGAVQNRTSGEWFIAEGKTVGTREDAVYHHFSAKAVYLDSMTVVGGGHQTAFGVSDTNVIWCAIGGSLSTIRYRPDQTVGTRIATTMSDPVPGATNQISLTPTRTRAVIRRVQTDVETYSLFPKDDNGRFGARIGHAVTVDRSDARVVQGFGASNSELRILTGHSNAASYVERYSFDTGKPLSKPHDRINVTDWGIYPGEEPLKIEVEGLDGTRIGVKIGQGDIRELRVLDIDYSKL